MLSSLDEIVQLNDKQNQHLTWNKLNKSLKLKRMIEFATEFSMREALSDEQTEQLKTMLRDKLDKKCLHRAHDVKYNSEEQKIISIPGLIYTHQKYTLRSDVASPLQSLAPKNKTKKIM
jgi:hypothetical protein